MNLSNKISIFLLLTNLILGILLGFQKVKNGTLTNDLTSINIKLKEIEKSNIQLKKDFDFNQEMVEEIQKIILDVNNEKFKIEKENKLLRKGVRLDLLKIRVRRNGKPIDSLYTEGYKYLDK
jgi:hypothetical protein